MFVRTLPFGVVALICLTLGSFLATSSVSPPWFFLAYSASLWFFPAVVFSLLGRYQPDLLRERLHPPSDQDRTTRLASLVSMLLVLTLAGLESASQRRDPLFLHLAGLGLCLTAFSLVAWTLLSNPFASSAVRIQKDRDHKVITTGPYASVRHPMYLGVLLFGCGTPLALGSVWAFAPVIVLLGFFVRRTLKEDAMLRAQLPGYEEYAARVRWRVLPGVF